MKLIINQTLSLAGNATPPSSKSHSIRAIMLAAMCEGESVLTNVLNCEDTDDAIQVCKNLGVEFSELNNGLVVKSKGVPFNASPTEIQSGNSGVTTHFIMPMLGLRADAHQSVILNCGEQMRSRPVSSLVAALKNLGLDIHFVDDEGKLPIRISGRLMGGKTGVDGVTSQYLSALLFALPCAEGDSEIKVENLQERPYVEMTLNWLKDQKIQLHYFSEGNLDTYQIKGGQRYKNFQATIPGDFSSASYLISAGVLIPGEIRLKGLDMKDAQGDKKLIALLQAMGADIVVKSDCICIKGGKQLSGMAIDANDIPDLVPVLAVIGACASGQTEIYNVAHARIKETDRIRSMADGLTLMGAKVEEKTGGLVVYSSQLRGANVNGYGDHRTVMALSVAAMVARGETVIDGSEAINKTFPTFVEMMRSLGARMEVEREVSA